MCWTRASRDSTPSHNLCTFTFCLGFPNRTRFSLLDYLHSVKAAVLRESYQWSMTVSPNNTHISGSEQQLYGAVILTSRSVKSRDNTNPCCVAVKRRARSPSDVWRMNGRIEISEVSGFNAWCLEYAWKVWLGCVWAVLTAFSQRPRLFSYVLVR